LLFSVYLFYVVAMFVGDRRWPQPGWPVRGPWYSYTAGFGPFLFPVPVT